MHSILLHPLHPEQLFVSNQSSTCYLMNMNGQVIKALQSGKRQGGGEGAGVACTWMWVGAVCSCFLQGLAPQGDVGGHTAVHAWPPAFVV